MKLSAGDKIALFAPAGAVSEKELLAGIKILESWGLRIYIPERIFETHRYLAGPDESRAREFRELFLSGDFKALWAARGGFGSIKILPYLKELELTRKRSYPIIIGFSDLSILLNHLFDRFQIPSWHAPTVTFLARLSKEACDKLKALLLGRERFKTNGLPLIQGEAEGFLCGGNLASLVSLLGTPYFPDLSGKILILEETNEKLYRLERLFTQLALAGIFERVSGLVIGDLCGLPPEEYLSILKEILPPDLPTGYAFKIGHFPESRAFPIGQRARLTISEGQALLFEIDK